MWHVRLFASRASQSPAYSIDNFGIPELITIPVKVDTIDRKISG
jgi:hypothetical protein